MRINELIVESNNLDEISLAGIGKGLGKAATGIGKTVGATIGGAGALGSAVKAGYQAGKAGARQSILGKGSSSSNAAPDDQQPVTTPTTSQQAAGGTAPNQSSADQLKQQLDVAYQQGQRHASQQPASTGSAPAAARPVAAAPTLKAPPVALGNLDSFKKSYSSLDPAEREQLKKDLEVIDDQDRLATGTNESLDDIIKLARS